MADYMIVSSTAEKKVLTCGEELCRGFCSLVWVCARGMILNDMADWIGFYFLDCLYLFDAWFFYVSSVTDEEYIYSKLI